MLTKEIENRLGKDITFLFKGNEPYTPIKNPKGEDVPGGTLIEKNGKVQCYECGKWFKSVGSHVKEHGMTVREYKEKYGYNFKAGLCSKETSGKYSKEALQRIKSGSLPTFSKGCANGGPKGGTCRKIIQLQRQNKRNTCPAQYEERLKLLVAKFGPSFTQKQCDEFDRGLGHWIYEKHGNLTKFKKKFKLTPNEEKIKKDDADLIYDLRKYVEDMGRLPWKTRESMRRLDNFPHSIICYRNSWGATRKAWLHCGIRRVGKDWEVIN